MSAQLLSLGAAEILPTRAAVLASQGIARESMAPRRILDLADQAQRLLQEQVEARGLCLPVEGGTFEAIYASQELDAAGPVPEVARQAAQRALFVVTLGQRVGDTIARLFAEHDFALASFLDGAASEMAERAVSWLERYTAQAPAAAHDPGHVVLAYSPGYCGWHLSGQQALLQALEPAQIGVCLSSSFLMSPIKSVSGVLLDGPPAIHRLEPRYDFCKACRSKTCVERRRRLEAPTSDAARRSA